MKQQKRIQALITLLKTHPFDNHQSVLEALKQQGIPSTQATLSRDLNRLGVFKLHGFYQLPSSQSHIQIKTAGEHLLVIKTLPGHASALGAEVDAAGFEGLAGTVAGDDTLFIATRDLAAQNQIQKALLEKLA